jgi:hypothetical protein
MSSGSKKGASAQKDTGPSGNDTPGKGTAKCKLKPPKKETVEPEITVVDPFRWYHATVQPEKNLVGSVTLKATKRDDNLGYKEKGTLTADNANVQFYSDSKCKKKINPATTPVTYKFGSLCSGVTLYYKGETGGTTNLTLTLAPAKDGRITVLGPATGAVEVRICNIVTPKVELEYKIVLFDNKLADKQKAGETKIRPSPTYIEASASQTLPAYAYTKTGKLEFTPANVDAFTDEACTTKLTADLTAAQLLANPRTKIWLRGKTEGKYQVKLTLADPATDSIRLDKNPTPDQEMGVVKFELKLHQQDIATLKSAQIDPDTNPEATYYTNLKNKTLDQKLMTDAEKIGEGSKDDADKPGRLLHAQNSGNFGRAKLIVVQINTANLPAGTDDYDIPLKFGRGWAPDSGNGALKTEDLQGGGQDNPLSGSIAFYDAEFDGTIKNNPSYKISALKAADQTLWVQGTGETDQVCDVRLDVGMDRAPGGLAKTIKRNADWTRYTVVKIDEVKLDYTPVNGQPVAWDGAKKEWYINMKTDAAAADPGRKVKIAAKLTKKFKNVELFFMLAPDANNKKAANWGKNMPGTWTWSAITAGVKHLDRTDRKNFLHLSEKTDADGKASKELSLSRFGGDKFRPAVYIGQDAHLAKYVEGNTDLERRKPVWATDKIEVSRKFWYQLIEVAGVNNPGVAGAVGQYELVKARMDRANPKVVNPAPAGSIYPRYMVKLDGDNSNALMVSNLNKNSFFTGIAAEGDKPIKVPILVCDAQWDTGPDTLPFTSGWVAAGTVLDISSDRLILKPPLAGGSLWVDGYIACKAPNGTGGWTNGPSEYLSDANLVVTNPRTDLRGIRLTLPGPVQTFVNNQAGSFVKIVDLKMQGAKGPYLGESFDKKVLAVYEPANADDFQNTIAHELGHGFKQVLRAGQQPTGAPALPTQYISYDSDGVSTGSHCNHATNKCVMYQSGPITGSLNRFCDDCHPYLLSTDMATYS